MTNTSAATRTTKRIPTAVYIVAGIFAALLIAIGVGFATGFLAIYDAPGNAGVTITNVGGFEWRGTPGFFTCDGQC